MRPLIWLWSRVADRRQWEQNMDDELRFHIEARTAHWIAKGMSRSQAARQARVEFGGLERHKEFCREASWPARVFDELCRNTRDALRSLAKSPGYAAIGVVSLALGVGASLATFSLVDRLMLTPLAVRDPHNLYEIGVIRQGQFENSHSYVHYDQELRQVTDFFDALAWSQNKWPVEANGDREIVTGAFVSGSYFPVLSVNPVLGRILTDEDDHSGTARVAVLGYAAWKKFYDGSTSALGQSLKVRGVPFQIVGVVPAWFRGLELGEPPDFFIPLHGNLAFNKNAISSEGFLWLRAMARLKPGASLEAARAALRARSEAAGKPTMLRLGRLDSHPVKTLEDGSHGYSAVRTEFSRALVVLLALAGIVLLIACANLSTLLFVRGAGRTSEMSLRLALGASPAQLIRQWMTESLLISGAGTVAGILLARRIVEFLLGFVREDARPYLQFHPTRNVALLAVILTIGTALAFGLLPALRVTRGGPGIAVKEPVSRRRGLTRVVLAFQVAASLALITGAGLFLRTLWKLNSDGGGYARSQIVYAYVTFPGNAAPANGSLDEMVERLKQSPMLASVSLGNPPMSGGGTSWVTVPGYVPRPVEDNIVYNLFVAPGYFRTVGISMLAGRDFDAKERTPQPDAVIVSESFVRHYFKDKNPLGAKVRPNSQKPDLVEIVGVVRDAKSRGLRAPIRDVVYWPLAPGPAGTIVARTKDPADRAAALSLIQTLVKAESQKARVETFTMEETIQRSLRRDTLVAELSASLGMIGLLLAAIGIYGVMAHDVASRVREIGVRIALGAVASHIFRSVLREPAIVVGSGILVGIPITFVSARLVDSLLYGISSNDPASFAGAAAILALAALAAALPLVRRAIRTDPMQSLRCE